MPKFEVTVCRCDTLVVVVEAEDKTAALDAGHAFVSGAPYQDEFMDSCDSFNVVEAHAVSDDKPLSQVTLEQIVVSGRERDMILAGLRMWQHKGFTPPDLSDAEIDALCERINCGG